MIITLAVIRNSKTDLDLDLDLDSLVGKNPDPEGSRGDMAVANYRVGAAELSLKVRAACVSCRAEPGFAGQVHRRKADEV